MLSDSQKLAFELELLLNLADAENVPTRALEIYKENCSYGVPSKIVYSESSGWVVLSSSGQGPCIDWSDK